jgi:hypothetical protein
MKTASWAGLLGGALIAIASAQAADNVAIERLATCQDSWLEWKSGDPAQLRKFAGSFQADFHHQKDTDAFFVPKSNQTVAGLPLAQVFPDSIGMAVGFSVLVNASFDRTKATLEKRLGKPIGECEPPSDNMRSCGLKIGEKKTVLLVASDDPKSTTSLFGCYYFYEK